MLITTTILMLHILSGILSYVFIVRDSVKTSTITLSASFILGTVLGFISEISFSKISAHATLFVGSYVLLLVLLNQKLTKQQLTLPVLSFAVLLSVTLTRI
jgi:hypothetical protein